MKNKLFKLPIFLGIVVAVCGCILAVVYSFTNPIIKQNQKEAANKAYISMYSQYNVTSEDISDSIEVTDITGCTSKVIIEKAKGVCYTCSCGGFGGTINFLVAFADGKYLSYSDLGNSETGSYGQVVIGQIADIIKGVDANSKLLDNGDYSALIAGKSVTGKAIANEIENCRADYLAWYQDNK